MSQQLKCRKSISKSLRCSASFIISSNNIPQLRSGEIRTPIKNGRLSCDLLPSAVKYHPGTFSFLNCTFALLDGIFLRIAQIISKRNLNLFSTEPPH
jgi:hypothetical protein